MSTLEENEKEAKKCCNVERSGEWPKIRKEHLEKQPKCALCGGSEKLEVHHIKPFHLHPDLELNPDNLITLCEANKEGFDCHLAFGHLGNFKSWNENVIQDCITWNAKLTNRPYEIK